MKFGKSITRITTGLALFGMVAGTNAAVVMAAESTTKEYALEIALADAGLSEDDVTVGETEKGKKKGASVYEIDFWTDSKDYDYDIAVADGEIVSVGWERTDASPDGKQITQASAQNIALSDAGLNANKVTFTKAIGGIDDGISVYEFKFNDRTTEYKYVIAKNGGEILEYEKTVKTPACVTAAQKSAAGAK